jgi:hypothetical protein
MYRYERPILASREPDASEKVVLEAGRLQKELSTIVNEFILKRGNILNAKHLPPKLVQFVCCRYGGASYCHLSCFFADVCLNYPLFMFVCGPLLPFYLLLLVCFLCFSVFSVVAAAWPPGCLPCRRSCTTTC